MRSKLLGKNALLAVTALLITFAQEKPSAWKPDTDWGHWRLGQKADLEFLKTNSMTITFGSGAPSFEEVSRDEFNRGMEQAKANNRMFHDKGYVVLRYLTSSIHGRSASNKDVPQKDQIRMLQFWREKWNDYEDYLGPKPTDDPTTWITVRPDGSFPHYRYAPYGQETTSEFETWGCPNNPHFTRLMEGRIRAQAETGIDGSYIDWTQISGETCYCGFCKRNFAAYLKKNLPASVAHTKYGTDDYENITLPKKRGEPFWMEWVTFRGHSVAEFHRRMREVARQYNPNFLISGNVFGGFGYGPISYDAAGNMEMLGRDGYDDFIYSEVQEYLDSAPRKDEHGTKITNSPAFKFLAAVTHGKPVIVYATEITPPIFPNPTEGCLSAMSQINIAEAVANHAVFREKRLTPPGATQMYQFLAANEGSLRNVRMQANVGVVASLRQYLADELSFAFSASRVLADNGISHVMLAEDDLTNPAINQFDMVVVPYLPLMSSENQQALVRYAKAGGTLLILGSSGNKDQYGLSQRQIVLAQLLAGGQYPAAEATRRVGKGQVIFIPVQVPPSRFLIPMKSRGDYTTFGPTMADVFPDIPEGYTRNRIDPTLRKLLERVAAKVQEGLGTRVTRLASATPYVEITTMMEKTDQWMLLHVVNYDVTVDGTITPARGLKVQVAIPRGKKARSVTWSGTLTEMKPLEYKTASKGGRQMLLLDLNEVNIYGLAKIELE
jgi:hypothetical protein